MINEVVAKLEIALAEADDFDFEDKVELVNELRELLHEFSPFKNEPVDFVRWVKSDDVVANEYNPNKVAPPEMELLEISIMNDGYTQPIVTWPRDGISEVVDGFHRSRVGKESKIVEKRIQGYLPTVAIRNEQADKNDRIASTIRHNRARGKHQIDAMSEIVIELKNRNWRNARIARELGMDEDEVLRLCQISGLEHLFSDSDFSNAWESEDSVIDGFEELTDDLTEEDMDVRIPNKDDEERIMHTYDKWECYQSGFFKRQVDGMSKEECEQAYADFLTDNDKFESALNGVISDWTNSCEHYLTNRAMNRIAWLGQASMCYSTGIPSVFCSGYNLLERDQQEKADELALKYLNKWRLDRDLPILDMDEALSSGRQVEIY